MPKRSLFFVAVLLLVGFSAIRADTGARLVEPMKPWEALWRFDTHG